VFKSSPEDRSSVPEKIAQSGKNKVETLKSIETETGVPEAELFGVETFYHLLNDPDAKVRVCQGLSCRMAGSEKILEAALAAGLPALRASCLGACDRPVPVLVERSVHYDTSEEQITSCGSDWEKLGKEFAKVNDERYSYVWQSDDPEKVAFDLKGDIEWSATAFKKIKDMSTEEVLKELEASGLQGRGGAGFPAGRKWQSLLMQEETHRYVVLNADEAEPGTFKDREIMLRRPDMVLEGLAIAAHVIGAKEVYLYIRGEFEFPQKIMGEAIKKVEELDLYPGIHFHIHSGHGAYICGEETALLEALEGKRGMPRLKPPFPTEVGLWGKPTLIHNVETIAAIPPIIKKGGEWFHKIGKTGPGSKLYCISGHVKTPGVYELPLGITLDELVEVAGGYIGTLRMFSPGGSSSGYLHADHRNVPIDFTSMRELGSTVGSAGVVVINDTYGIKEAVQDQLQFYEDESCGQCAPCRIGTRYQRDSLDKYVEAKTCGNKAAKEELSNADELEWEMKQGSICGLGHTASAPLTSAMKWFPGEFE
jgi:NADH:ubiquinone oxidoreductase subunit F (NADH-binding)